MFDKFLCKHIQKSEISVFDAFMWIINTRLFCVTCLAAIALSASYFAWDLSHNVKLSDDIFAWEFRETFEFAFVVVFVLTSAYTLIIYMFSICAMCTEVVFNMKIAHFQNKDDEKDK